MPHPQKGDSMYTLKELLTDAKKNHYAVGSFNFNDFDDSYGMVQGAAELNSPIILMTSVSIVTKFIKPATCVKIAEGLEKEHNVPICLFLDHCTDFNLIKECIDAGYKSVMIDASKYDYLENIRITKEVVEYAHERGVSVEAELGKISGHEDNVNVEDKSAFLTDPEDVAYFVKETGVDALAVSIGTAHGFYKEAPHIDFERLEKIVAKTDCPLVLHGGTGVPLEDLKKAVEIGVCKVNVGTEFKKRFTDAIKRVYINNPEEIDPRPFMREVRNECANAVKEKIEIFGSKDKKENFQK